MRIKKCKIVLHTVCFCLLLYYTFIVSYEETDHMTKIVTNI